MTIADGVKRYVLWKQEYGYSYERGATTLRAFEKAFPGMNLVDIDANHILMFLNRPSQSTATWRSRYWTLFRFFEHWFNRGETPHFVMPTPKPAGPRTFIPHIFTHAEVRALLLSTSHIGKSRGRIDCKTLRAIILFLYATGASVGELAGITLTDIDFERRLVKLSSTRAARARRIPIGNDLLVILAQLVEGRPLTEGRNVYLFENSVGGQVSASRFAWQFRRLRRQAGIRRREGARNDPRVDDLRYTFAVHRITSWIEEGRDLNRMLPALAAYMGQVGLGSTERYLFLTPERFRQDIDKLSPTHGRGKWSEDQNLMNFLTGL